MGHPAEHSAFMMVPTVAAFEELSRKLDRLLALSEQQRHTEGTEDAYIEPGPGSLRQYFTAQELAKRWGWGKTKVYELLETELPRWKHGEQVRFFWAYVWAFEGRISREEADRLWHSTGNHNGSVQTAKLRVLPHSPAEPPRVRTPRADKLSRAE